MKSFEELSLLYEISEALNATKKVFRELPHKGASYGMLRYLHPDAGVRQSLAQNISPEILFNFLGHAEQLLPKDSPFELKKPLDLYRGKNNPRTTAIEINAHFVAGKLEIHWSFSPMNHNQEIIESYANRTLENVMTLLDPNRLELKFPQANLNKKGLNKLENLMSKLDSK